MIHLLTEKAKDLSFNFTLYAKKSILYIYHLHVYFPEAFLSDGINI